MNEFFKETPGAVSSSLDIVQTQGRPADWIHATVDGGMTWRDGTGNPTGVAAAGVGDVFPGPIRSILTSAGKVRYGTGPLPLYGARGATGATGATGAAGATGATGAAGTSIPVHGQLISAGGDTATINKSARTVGVSTCSIIDDPDGRSTKVVRVDFSVPFPDTDYAFFATAYMAGGSAYGQWAGYPTVNGKQSGYCIFRLVGGSDGNPFHDATTIMIQAI